MWPVLQKEREEPWTTATVTTLKLFKKNTHVWLTTKSTMQKNGSYN
jgi:hypothetical protein